MYFKKGVTIDYLKIPRNVRNNMIYAMNKINKEIEKIQSEKEKNKNKPKNNVLRNY